MCPFANLQLAHNDGYHYNNDTSLHRARTCGLHSVCVWGAARTFNGQCNGGDVGVSQSQVSSGLLQTAQTWANAELVVDCAHALWVVLSTKRLVSLMLLKWFYLIVLFILC